MTDVSSTPSEPDAAAGTGIDTTVPHSARIWNYWLGGKDNYAVDREAGDQFSAIYPGIVDIARADRAFLGRVVRYLAGQAGVRQFLDVGAGLPTAVNTHEAANQVTPDARTVYVDNDPLVVTHAEKLLATGQQSKTHFVNASMDNPDEVLREAARWLDLTQPVGLTLMGVLGHVTDYAAAKSIVLSGRTCTSAATRWPSRSSGTPTTSASKTSGWDLSASSTSSGKTFSPPVLTHMFPRPSKVIVPSSSRRAKSPGTT